MASSDPLWKQIRVPVISGILLFSFASLWTEPVRTFFGNCWSALFSDVTMPLWLSLFLWTSLLIVIFFLSFGVFNWLNEKRKGPFAQYTSDVFYDIKWCWKFTLENQLSGLKPLCVKCDRIVRAFQGNEMFAVNPVCVSCEPCNSKIYFDYDFEELKRKVILEIDHKMRTESWRESVKKQSGNVLE